MKNAGRPHPAAVLESLTFGMLGVLACLAVFVWLAQEVGAGETLQFDAAIHRFFQAHPSPPLSLLMAMVSLLAGGWAITALSVMSVFLLCFRPVLRDRAFSLLLAGAGGQGVVSLLKALFHRARPEAAFASLGYSFPSGHAFAAVTIYGLFAYWLSRGRASVLRLTIGGAALLLILLIGFSRVYLGVHYASDVAAGFVSGFPWLWGCLAVSRQGRRKETH